MRDRKETRLRVAFSVFGPPIAAKPPLQVARAGLGAFAWLRVAGLFVLSRTLDLDLGL